MPQGVRERMLPSSLQVVLPVGLPSSKVLGSGLSDPLPL